MRTVFNRELLEMARQDERIFLVLADIGYGEVEAFMQAFPDRFLNVGVAEQNMTGVACGLALEGNVAVTYSINNFVYLRPLEQIRNDVCYHNVNVKMIVIGGGLPYGALGVSHHATEDIAIMRVMPNAVLVCPCDLAEAAAAARAIFAHEGPAFYRCGRKREPPVHPGPIDFELGKAIRIREGADLTFIFTGTIGNQVLPAAEELDKDGIRSRVISMHTVKPIDRDAIVAAARETGGIVVVEEHQVHGGLAGAVAEVLCGECAAPEKFLGIGFPDTFVTKVGGHQWLLDQYGLSTRKIVQRVKEAWR